MTVIPFDDRDGTIWMDGKLVPWRDAKLHVLSHGLHYASVVFEGERAYGGHIFELTKHSQRLIDSGRILGFEIPYTAQQIDDACKLVLADNKLKDAYVRPIAWRGSEMMGVAAQAAKIRVAVAVWEWPSYFSPEAKMKGIRLQMSPWRRPDPATIPCKAKAAGLYMICTLSKHKAEDEGYQDSMMLDYRGLVAEATGANAFFVIDGKIHTPTPDCFLNGITRQTVIALAKKRGFEVIERHIKPEEMGSATECFLTGSAAEVTPVSEIGDYRFTPASVCKTLMEDYSALVNSGGKITV
jgi:branched-chain amino acid aminotransferase